jgi:AcrR family transcriptional regulator
MAVPRMSPASRRSAIIDATLAVVMRKGFASTTVRDVAAELGCSSGLIHHYFTSMDDVLAEAFNLAAGRDLEITEAAVSAVAGPIDKLEEFFSSYTRLDEDWAYQLWLDAWAEARRRPALGAISRQLNVAWQQVLVRILRDGIRTGTFHCADPDGSAWRILSALDGLSLQSNAHGQLIDRNTIIDWSFIIAESELGLAPNSLPRPLPAGSTASNPAAG